MGNRLLAAMRSWSLPDGLGHYRMRGYYTIQTQGDFDAWLASQPAGL
jgi:hypothetical protein